MTNHSTTDDALPVGQAYTLPPRRARGAIPRAQRITKRDAARIAPYTTTARAVAGSRWTPTLTPQRIPRRARS